MMPELMTGERIANLRKLIEATRQDRDQARLRMNEAKNQKSRREAEEDLNFWEGKIDACERNLKQLEARALADSINEREVWTR